VSGRRLHLLAVERTWRTSPWSRPGSRWLDTWRGIGDVVTGMARHEYDLELRALRRARLAGSVLPSWFRAFTGGRPFKKAAGTRLYAPEPRSARLDADGRVA
jgi:hypothetical protein